MNAVGNAVPVKEDGSKNVQRSVVEPFRVDKEVLVANDIASHSKALSFSVYRSKEKGGAYECCRMC